MRALILLVLLLPSIAQAQRPEPIWPQQPVMTLPFEVQEWFRNPDGSCVQCSNSMLGAQRQDWALATLLYSTHYGRAERGGSGPDRVARYCKERKVEIYNVTGRRWEDIRPWVDWACKTGRFGGIGCFPVHYQTAWGKNADGRWYVANNWFGLSDKPYLYNESQMKKHVEDSGAWFVCLVGPPAPIDPFYIQWRK